MEAFSRYFAEATLDDPKAAGVRALIPGFHRPPGTAAAAKARNWVRSRSTPTTFPDNRGLSRRP